MPLEPSSSTTNLTGIYLPENAVQDVSAFEKPEELGTLEGFGVSVLDSIGNNPSINLSLLGQRELAKKFSPGRLLTKNAWEKSEFFRSNLSFDDLKTSEDSVAENVARIAAHKLDVREANEARLNNMKPGFLSGATKFAGETIGFLLDPINISAFKGTSLIIGKGNSLMLDALGKTAFSRSRQVGLGLAEGALITVPSSVVSFESDKVFGQDPSAMAALATIGLNAGLGGIIRGAFGFKEPITTESYRDAMETAGNQLSAGKSVNVDEIVQNGYRDARLREQGNLEKAPTETRENINQNIKFNKENISKLEDELTRTAEKEKFDEKIRSKLKKDKGLTAKEIIIKEKEISDKPSFQRDSLDRLFLKNISVNEEIKKAIDVSRTPKELRTEEEEQFLSDMINGKEENFLRRRLNSNQEEIQKIESQVKESPDTLADAERLTKELDAFKQKISHGEVRLSEITGKRRESPKIVKIKKEISEARKKSEVFERTVQHHETANSMRNHEGESVNYNQVKASSQRVNSWEGNSSINKAQNEAFNRQTQAIPEEPQIENLNDIEEIVKSLDLTKEEKNILDEASEIEGKFETMKKAIREAAECLIRSAE